MKKPSKAISTSSRRVGISYARIEETRILVLHRTYEELLDDVQQRCTHVSCYSWNGRENTLTEIAIPFPKKWRFLVVDELLQDKVCGQVFESVEGIENVPPSMLDVVLSRVRP